jgi:hypothetical protein
MGKNTPKIIYKFVGANNVDDPSEVSGILSADPFLILSEMTELSNVDVNNNGKVLRRRGYTLRVNNAAHSMWSNNKECYFIENGFLKRFNSDYTINIVGTLPSNRRAVYEQVNDVIVISDGDYYRILQDNFLYSADVKDGLPPVGGQTLCFFKGRLYIGKESNIYFTLPYDIETMDEVNNLIPLASYVKMIVAVDDGMFISTSKEIFFFKGNSPEEFEVIKVANYPAIYGTATKCKGEIFGEALQGVSSEAIIFATTQGICVAGDSGFFRNISKYKFQYKPGTFGTAILKEQNGITQYIMNTYKEEDEYNIYQKTDL